MARTTDVDSDWLSFPPEAGTTSRLVPKSVTPVSRPSGVSSAEDTIWSKTFFGIKSFFIGLPPPVKFVHVLGGDDDCLGKRVLCRVPHVSSPQVTEPAVTDPVVAFGMWIHVHPRFLIGVFGDGSLDDNLINPSGTLAAQPSPKSGHRRGSAKGSNAGKALFI